ncbi:type II toxin-antitoxin system VapC family toxin [Foetidibacter luteolus]|uniref:type II toxin-antitoxin system VapC family toxin n=1 Tax=Foetidibacter luteolus TaxID=2608880 RepID=UPI00129BBBD7|nr:type II toxin-antitoxin system VapC family toxin [Foetidibacter luteolus]
MTGNNYLLDSNIIIEIFDGDKAIADRLDKLPTFYIPVIVLGELYIGVNRVTNKTKHLKMLTNFLALGTVLNVNGQTANIYGEMIARLYKKGKPIPTNDVWIAAIAYEHSLTLVTRDVHFNEIDKISIETW